MKFTKEQVKDVYVEVDRRLDMMIFDGSFENDSERRDYVNAMMQGVYSVFCATASNWVEVAQWCCDFEKEV